MLFQTIRVDINTWDVVGMSPMHVGKNSATKYVYEPLANQIYAFDFVGNSFERLILYL